MNDTTVFNTYQKVLLSWYANAHEAVTRCAICQILNFASLQFAGRVARARLSEGYSSYVFNMFSIQKSTRTSPVTQTLMQLSLVASRAHLSLAKSIMKANLDRSTITNKA